MKINKSKEYTFVEAWRKAIESNEVFITSKITGDSYKIDKYSKGNLLKFYSVVIDAWQKCTYLLPEELFNSWYITPINN